MRFLSKRKVKKLLHKVNCISDTEPVHHSDFRSSPSAVAKKSSPITSWLSWLSRSGIWVLRHSIGCQFSLIVLGSYREDGLDLRSECGQRTTDIVYSSASRIIISSTVTRVSALGRYNQRSTHPGSIRCKRLSAAVCKSALYHLWRIGAIRHTLNLASKKCLVHALVISRLEYANFLFSGLPEKLLDSLQMVQNAAARLILAGQKQESAKPLLKTLHWLPVHQRIVDRRICTSLPGTSTIAIHHKETWTTAAPR